jgi:hypothetical protein
MKSMNQRITAFEQVPHWPKLAWAASVQEVPGRTVVLHGSCVEVASDWCSEAAWPGAFESGDFDQAAIVVGSALRVRDDEVVSVSSSDTLSRLFCFKDVDSWVVSNSLPALLTLAGISLVDGYPYADAMTSIINGLESYQRGIPSSAGPIRVVYSNNLKLVQGEMIEVPKPAITAAFPRLCELP